VALVYGQHSGGSVGHRERDHLHMNDGQLYQYQSSSRASGAGGPGVSPYLQYTRDIQNIYRRQKPHPSNESGLPKLPRINNQRDVANHMVSKGLPPIQVTHALAGSQLSGRNHGPSPLMYGGSGQGSYRNLKGRQRGIGQSVLLDANG